MNCTKDQHCFEKGPEQHRCASCCFCGSMIKQEKCEHNVPPCLDEGCDKCHQCDESFKPKESPEEEEKWETEFDGHFREDLTIYAYRNDLKFFIRNLLSSAKSQLKKEIGEMISKCPMIEELKSEGDMLWLGVSLKDNSDKSFRILPESIESKINEL